MTYEQAMEKLLDLMEENQDVLFRLKNNILTKEEKHDTIDIEKKEREVTK